MTEQSRLFEEKIADKDIFQYDGVSGGTPWRKEMMTDLIGRCGDMEALLDWAEKHGKVPFSWESVAMLRAGGA